MSDVAPPATGLWFDVDVTVDAVLHVLRLQGGDIDEPRLRDIVPGAAYRIDVYRDADLEVDGPPPPPDYQYALEQLTILRYRRDMPVVIMGTFPAVDDEEQLLDTVLGGRRERWGVA